MSALTQEQVTVEKLLPEIRATHKAFLESGKETVELARQIGDRLLKLKECVKHGEWESVVEKRCEFSIRTAQTYMKVAGGWKLIEKKDAAAATIDGCVKLIGQATPKKRSGPRKSPTPAESNGKHKQTSTPQTEAEQAEVIAHESGKCVRTGADHRWGPDEDKHGYQCCLECGEPGELIAVAEPPADIPASKLFAKIDEYMGKIVRLLDDVNRVAPNDKLRKEIFDSLEVANEDIRKWKKGAKK